MKSKKGFTLIELLVVLAIVASLLSIVVPKYVERTQMAKEVVLKDNLKIMRKVLDDYYADHDHYPICLDDLVNNGYIKKTPFDPITDSPTTWKFVYITDENQQVIVDIKSGAVGESLDGSLYETW